MRTDPTTASDLVLYHTEDGRDRIEVRLQDDTVWLSQAAMADLFETTKQNISNHLKNIFDEGELTAEATVKDSLTVQTEGSRDVSRRIALYKLEAIMDYDPKADETKLFFQVAQNKIHFAVSGKTAAELIAERADATQPNMGLTTWKAAKVRKADVTVAKNYLSEDEVAALNRLVTMYLDFAEDQAKRRRQIFQRDWRTKLDAFLQLNDRDILDNAGQVTKALADQLAREQYDLFNDNRIAETNRMAELEHEEELRRLEDQLARSEEDPES